MKKILLSGFLVAGISASLFAQGTISIDNLSNSSTSPSATSDGMFFKNGALMNDATLNCEIWGGPDAGTLTLIGTFAGANALVFGAPGQYLDPNGNTYTVTGVPLSGSATLRILAWTGAFTTYAQAQANGGASTFFTPAPITFTNPTGGGGIPAALPASLTGLSAVNLVPVPEPSTFALAGLGSAALLIFRRRK